MSDRHPCFTASQLEAICEVLADTSAGLTGSEIGHTLAQTGVDDPDPTMTKRWRLYNALVARQNQDQSGNMVLAFIHKALDPPRYSGRKPTFEQRRRAVNEPLAFYGLQYGEDGKFHRLKTKAHTLSEAQRRADRLRANLQDRNVDPELLRFCRSELLEDNYFHAVQEATKSVAEKIRDLTGLSDDGAGLVQAALGGDDPPLRINPFSTETHRSEQRGFVNLVTGLFGTFRNPTAHAPRISWPMDETDALDLLTLASYVHRRLRGATKEAR